MADNIYSLMNREGAWYPEEASQFHNKVFIKTLEQTRPDLYKRASDFFQIEKAFLSTTGYEANLGSLKKMAQREEEKEDNLLREIFGKDNYKAVAAGERIQIINSLYAAKGAFKANIEKIQAIEKNKGGGRIDITTKFAFYLKKEIESLVARDNLEELTESNIKQCIEQALYAMFFEYEKGTDNQPYAELALALDYLKSSSNQPWIIDELFSLYFGVPFNKVTQELAEGETAKVKSKDMTSKLWVDYLYGGKKGNVLEAVEAMTIDFLQKNLGDKKVSRTGATGMKADNIITYNIEVDLEKIFGEAETDAGRSVRARSVDRLEALFDKVGSQGGYIVEISDKNYSLTSDAFAQNKGFAAQTNFKLNNLEKLLYKMKVSKGDISSLMFVLANTDDTLVGGADAYDACTFIATYIGYYLFDDLQIDDNFGNISTQAVHLFNLDGVYIPLSVFLYAALEAFQKSADRSRDFVNVTYNSKFNYKKQNDGLQEEDWVKLYQSRMTESSVDIHFFGDFVNYIKANVQL